jgi:hypothetical protein
VVVWAVKSVVTFMATAISLSLMEFSITRPLPLVDIGSNWPTVSVRFNLGLANVEAVADEVGVI